MAGRDLLASGVLVAALLAAFAATVFVETTTHAWADAVSADSPQGKKQA